MRPTVSILVPHFQTLELTLLCLRLLRRKTRRNDYEVIVIDNGSQDGSGEELKKIEWVRLLRREVDPDERPALSHGLALNMGVRAAESSLILTIHTDTMILREDWLDFLLMQIAKGGSNCAMLGSWKMESPGPLLRAGKWLEESWRQLCGKKVRRGRYIRSHCALYRRHALTCRAQMFAPSEHASAGEELHEAIEGLGFSCRFLAPELLCRYVLHLNHATMALNKMFGEGDRHMPRTRAKAIQRIEKFFDSINAQEILTDESLNAA
ncbi:N-glycosyltransferase [Planctomycetes bacterium Pan216]|uniref:N-glycosyltransferase n=1 Tax=Kolteria novifilia TaxID=2527975 RepID=A0A518B9K5_9BACT|nr:N-glycosyltransferase [Planctomycetes bacterium Pan216]